MLLALAAEHGIALEPFEFEKQWISRGLITDDWRQLASQFAVPDDLWSHESPEAWKEAHMGALVENLETFGTYSMLLQRALGSSSTRVQLWRESMQATSATSCTSETVRSSLQDRWCSQYHLLRWPRSMASRTNSWRLPSSRASMSAYPSRAPRASPRRGGRLAACGTWGVLPWTPRQLASEVWCLMPHATMVIVACFTWRMSMASARSATRHSMRVCPAKPSTRPS